MNKTKRKELAAERKVEQDTIYPDSRFVYGETTILVNGKVIAKRSLKQIEHAERLRRLMNEKPYEVVKNILHANTANGRVAIGHLQEVAPSLWKTMVHHAMQRQRQYGTPFEGRLPGYRFN